ncbi:2,3-bisphosphoglycerate-independent phosphoglycerate mutase [Candidatus Woesearchaeota archaeon]|nr:2,3-bisphosphoglycerate-independent phosphoglycerate mutase [Candidatus Woesearchaeota archaeon]
MKSILVVLDGMADRPVPEFGGKTPLEFANTPALDSMARKGSTGQLDVLQGAAPESDAAVLSLLGYDPHRYYTGRGPLEAVGLGMEMKKGMLALRCNFATAGEYPELTDRRVARTLTSKESAEIAATINRKVRLKGASFRFIAGVAHRGVLMIKAKKALGSFITNTDPAYQMTRSGIPEALAKFEMKVQQATALDKESVEAARLVNEFTRKTFEVLSRHPRNLKRQKNGLLPANVIISRDAGNRLPDLYDISSKHRKKFAILADMPLEVGIGKLSGMDIVRLPLPTFGRRDHKIRVEKAVSALKKYDSLYIHIKGPDLYGHEGDAKGKAKCIEEIDAHFFSPLLRKLDMKKTVIAVTADHATPCSMKGHSGDAVPFLISGGKVPADGSQAFSEAQQGGFGKIPAVQFMELLMKYSS